MIYRRWVEWNNLTVEQQKGIIDSIEQLEENKGISHLKKLDAESELIQPIYKQWIK